MSADSQKRRAAAAALEHVTNGMTLGIGSGSTAKHLVELLGEKVRAGLTVLGIPTSEETRRLATEAGIDLVEPDEMTRIDLVIDGADEVDPDLNLIKGGGGAHLREKIIAAAGQRMIVIADKSKKVAQLGKFPLPVEIERFSWPLTVQAIRKALAENDLKSATLKLRPGARDAGGGVYLTDSNNYIADIQCTRIADPAALDAALRAIPGVIETGLFVGIADLAIFGTDRGVETLGA
ncbi:ribose-5-phosphate isomerase RpiA [Aquisalinus flavus]|uniref:Ribose-5-phosphate isomerase A n=1 Tax=Aquisalinus flavus TaxID=1526572 RepID=A0A8J2Y3Q1_9PROT|nr:ribose-5-phosphate isomerase RpiA [Aquisalinus flavus]MBD0426420.1 ribose-5-phosphate isomerase RpiA [Aquisalinus flavus]UNE48025.1 ribose-5-phosphate isomerase RpiA [Aquisalinus flavus]GGD08059.1 ribose-5-phosphate isomerase A [Aquisalinus flavus]